MSLQQGNVLESSSELELNSDQASHQPTRPGCLKSFGDWFKLKLGFDPNMLTMEQLYESVPKETIEKIMFDRQNFGINICISTLFINMLFQLNNLQTLLKRGRFFAPLYQWTMWIMLIVLCYLYKRKKMTFLAQPIIFLVAFRNTFAMLDFEGRRFWMDSWGLQFFIANQVQTVLIFMYLISLTFEKKIWRNLALFILYILLICGDLIIMSKVEFSFAMLLGQLRLKFSEVIFIALAFAVYLWIIKTLFSKDIYNLLLSFVEKQKL